MVWHCVTYLVCNRLLVMLQRDRHLASKGWFNPEDFTAQKVSLRQLVHSNNHTQLLLAILHHTHSAQLVKGIGQPQYPAKLTGNVC